MSEKDLERLLEAQRRVITRQRKLLIAAHDALCDEVLIHNRRQRPHARAVATLERIAVYLGWVEKKEEPRA
jgi:hypothetical protein